MAAHTASVITPKQVSPNQPSHPTNTDHCQLLLVHQNSSSESSADRKCSFDHVVNWARAMADNFLLHLQTGRRSLNCNKQKSRFTLLLDRFS